MTTPKKRILELALEEVVGMKTPPDLEARLLERTRRPSLRLPGWAVALAVAALIVAAVAARFVLFPSTPEPVAPPPTVAVFTADDEADAGAWIALLRDVPELSDPGVPFDLERFKAAWQARRDLLDLLDEKPAGWDWVRSRLVPLPEGMKEIPARSRLLAILSRGPDAETDPAVLAALRDEPLALDEETLVVLAERGQPQALSLLEQRILSSPPNSTLALPAALLALGGDDRGAIAMRRLIASPKMLEASPGEVLASAAGLHRIGDPDAWSRTTEALRALVAKQVAAGDLERARVSVAALILVRPAVADEARIRLGDIDLRAERLARTLEIDLSTAGAIEARLAELLD